jgi:dTDP-glucose pyrophosphorylase
MLLMPALQSTIILCASSIDPGSLPIGMHTSPAMVPVNGKPVISWILDDLIRKQITPVVIVLREQDRTLREFVERIYGTRLDVRFAQVAGGTIIHSLQAGLQAIPDAELIRLILGDTLITDSYEHDEDLIYVGAVQDSRRWCIIKQNDQGHVIDYLDKQELPGEDHLAVAGYYHFVHGSHLRSAVQDALTEQRRELAAVLHRYSERYPISTARVTDWYDFGHIDNLVDGRRRLLRPRHFNALVVNPILNTITKTSQNNAKLQAELNWYLHLPNELQVLTPRLLRYDADAEKVRIVQEYYGYPTLAELFVYGDLHGDVWRSILRHIMAIHHEFCNYTQPLQPADYIDMYGTKTWERIAQFAQQSPETEQLVSAPELTLNGQRLRNLAILRPAMEQMIERLSQQRHGTIMHGDLCFSNILFDVTNQILRMIDPRGSFGQPGIYGDPRYDLAKLRHSTHGLYDYITTDMFQLTGQGTDWNVNYFASPKTASVSKSTDEYFVAAGYDLREIQFIEGLLFISMPPLHRDTPIRQRLMYLTGLQLLNEVLTCE